VQRAQRHVAHEREVDVRPRRLEHQHGLAVARDADDLEQRLGEVEGAEALADRSCPGQYFAAIDSLMMATFRVLECSRSSSSTNARPFTIGMPITSK